ncbi:HTTM domain-containing protein [Flavimarina sp. Hel_I_48]|uniref:HTTM domain-containing protein n=1 Tax=Flavimarina sp. Hel_I_48 TaxID=1392488 RepID=UPI0004DF3E67|nr:HTTM domain-containing protein [Flavimarina sp. Hel_I_48]
MLNKWLYTRVDNSALVLFRIIFGLLITIEAWGAIATGWIDRTLLESNFNFHFIGLDFLQPLPGHGMYYYYGIMGLLGIFVMLGYRYRLSILGYAVMWAGVYFMQKSSYNNHYYLLLLLLCILACMPANRYLSLDVRREPALKQSTMPQWVYVVIIAQLWIVYTFGAIAKIYPDWLDGSLPGLLMKARSHYWLVGDVLQQEWTHHVIAYVGILFDALIIPALLWKPTRKVAFAFSIFFHLFNSIVFQIGIFPYMSLAFTLFFFPAETIRRIFLPKKPIYTENEVILPKNRQLFETVFIVYFIFQIGLPLRHLFIKDDVLWTEEGHRLSWRMMLRAKAGRITFNVIDKATKEPITIDRKDFLSKKQQRAVATKPDMIWQFCQYLKEKYAKEGRDIAIYIDCKVRVNDHDYETFIDPKVDMAAAEWDYFWHNEWIMPSQLNPAD